MEMLAKIITYARKKNYDISLLRGSLFSNSPFSNRQEIATDVHILKNYHALGIVILPASPVQEISESLEQATKLIDVLTDRGRKFLRHGC
jgi:hypothetical protein